MIHSNNAGAVHILFYDARGELRNATKISSVSSKKNDRLGASIAALGDVDGDGIPDLAVGIPGLDDGNTNAGGMVILCLRKDGSVKTTSKVTAKPRVTQGQ